MSYRQCPKRLYLEINKPELKEISAATEAAFRKGNEIGDIARRIYGTEDAIFIPFEGGLQTAKNNSQRALARDPRVPVFEATVQYNAVLIRADVMLPDGDGWHLIEVKASTSVKPEHLFDCAIQAWVLRRAGYRINAISLAHVNNRFEYPGSGDYGGLLLEEPIDEDVAALEPSVPEWVADARASVAGSEPEVAVGKRCYTPYECAFVEHCWPTDTQFPISGIGGNASKDAQGQWIARGYRDVRDIPPEELNDTQLRIQNVAKSGQAELKDGARQFMAELDYPRYYLDFETAGPAIPVWPETRPYKAIPFQWSCHIEAGTGQLEHAEFLDLTGDLPVRRFAESLIGVLGENGPIVVYSSYERRIIKECMARFDDLRQPLERIQNGWSTCCRSPGSFTMTRQWRVRGRSRLYCQRLHRN